MNYPNPPQQSDNFTPMQGTSSQPINYPRNPKIANVPLDSEGNIAGPIETEHGTILGKPFIGHLYLYKEHNPMLYIRRVSIYDAFYITIECWILNAILIFNNPEISLIWAYISFIAGMLFWVPILLLTHWIREDEYLYSRPLRWGIYLFTTIRKLLVLLTFALGVFSIFRIVKITSSQKLDKISNDDFYTLATSISWVLFTIWLFFTFLPYFRAVKEINIETKAKIGFVHKRTQKALVDLTC